jgi:hypothetical protein
MEGNKESYMRVFEQVLEDLRVDYPEVNEDISARFGEDHPIKGEERVYLKIEILFEEYKQIFAALMAKKDPSFMANNKDFKLSDYGFFSRNHFSKKIY